ncbi:MAG: MBL fold metallo-hydrolase [Pseudomonadales bacterium]|nr:MBL fold metallo-hydrolase [Pseudomonadales bacterium]
MADESLLASGCFSPGNIQGSIICRVGPVDASLVNGVFGDPLLHLRFRDQKRGLLFDLGASGRIPARLIHQITDVFISHCHIDHIGGFFWLLRARIGDYPKCRLYGPPGLAEHINGMVNGVLWDRAGDKAPRFEVSELHKNKLHTWAVTAGVKKPKFLHCKETEHGILLNEATFCVRATTLDHGVPVLAFSFEPARQFKVQKEAIKKLGLTPGPWLQKLKHCLLLNDPKIRTQTTIRVSNGQIFSAEQLAEKILKTAEAQKLAYATDFADTPDNHRRLARLADHAQIFFCEASFLNKDIEKAQRTGHLTTSACGRIATEAHVAQLIPFHFSRRYETDPATVYSQIQAVCSQTRLPDVNEMH